MQVLHLPSAAVFVGFGKSRRRHLINPVKFYPRVVPDLSENSRWKQPGILLCTRASLKYSTKAEAFNRKKEIEYKENLGVLVVPACSTLNDLLREYVALYGKEKWAFSTYSANTALIEHYVSPLLGNMKLKEINTRVMEKYYQRLLKTPSVEPTIGKKRNEFLSPSTVKSIHKLLHSCFEQAVKWEVIEKNPCTYATLPKVTYAKREIWTADVLFHAMEVCDDERLKLSINLSFACSVRIGELLGLTWDCVDISPESIEAGTAYIYINKELQRVNRNVLEKLDKKDVITIFPAITSKTTTLQVLKAPKTQTSNRKIFLPKTVAEMLTEWKSKQDAAKEMLGSEYQDFNLVIAGPLGMPTEAATITAAFRKLIEENDLPPVVFHSLRHSSITYKLKLNGTAAILRQYRVTPATRRRKWSQTSIRISSTRTGSITPSCSSRLFMKRKGSRMKNRRDRNPRRQTNLLPGQARTALLMLRHL